MRQLTLAQLGWRYDLQAGVWRHADVPFPLSDEHVERMPPPRWWLLVTTMASACPVCTRPLWPCLCRVARLWQNSAKALALLWLALVV